MIDIVASRNVHIIKISHYLCLMVNTVKEKTTRCQNCCFLVSSSHKKCKHKLKITKRYGSWKMWLKKLKYIY